jgi:hypothetical protein
VVSAADPGTTAQEQIVLSSADLWLPDRKTSQVSLLVFSSRVAPHSRFGARFAEGQSPTGTRANSLLFSASQPVALFMKRLELAYEDAIVASH